ncbi:acetylglutamate kinase [Reichenbachiella versicolor]|uniref:acetylglutamate kinase n=1 Tax=Reichenbachiella versicolor TaxID=1821036 RepID=UPI000D6E396A|nr:acetylglutamate kinase [Reichenbachiella versicolor]
MSKLTIVKIGGKVINEEDQLDSFLKKFAAIKGDKILVHGGGNIASKLQEKLGVPVNMVEGRRVTDKEAIEIVSMVFSGLNKKIVAKMQANGEHAVGLSGADGNAIQSVKRPIKIIDYGFVGDVKAINAEFIRALLQAGTVPVFCALTHDKQGQLLNTNADTIASEIAVGMSDMYDVDLVYCFEQPGVLSDFEKKTVISEITPVSYKDHKDRGVISDGMIPKLDNAFNALGLGVFTVKIGHFDSIGLVQSNDYPGTIICLN